MHLTEKEVRYVANLANLSLTEEEIGRMVLDLGGILEQMDRLVVVRSLHHRCTAHGKGMYWNMTGHPPPNPEVADNRSPELSDSSG